MNKMLLYLLTACCLNAFGQTASSPNAARMFSIPRAQLQVAAVKTEDVVRATDANDRFTEVASLSSREPQSDFSLRSHGDPSDVMNSSSRQFNEALYYRLEAEGCFTRREPPSALSRTVNGIFSPEVIRIGKSAKFSCSVVTAIKRKNPLCLLNPIVVNFSW